MKRKIGFIATLLISVFSSESVVAEIRLAPTHLGNGPIIFNIIPLDVSIELQSQPQLFDTLSPYPLLPDPDKRVWLESVSHSTGNIDLAYRKFLIGKRLLESKNLLASSPDFSFVAEGANPSSSENYDAALLGLVNLEESALITSSPWTRLYRALALGHIRAFSPAGEDAQAARAEFARLGNPRAKAVAERIASNISGWAHGAFAYYDLSFAGGMCQAPEARDSNAAIVGSVGLCTLLLCSAPDRTTINRGYEWDDLIRRALTAVELRSNEEIERAFNEEGAVFCFNTALDHIEDDEKKAQALRDILTFLIDRNLRREIGPFWDRFEEFVSNDKHIDIVNEIDLKIYNLITDEEYRRRLILKMVLREEISVEHIRRRLSNLGISDDKVRTYVDLHAAVAAYGSSMSDAMKDVEGIINIYFGSYNFDLTNENGIEAAFMTVVQNPQALNDMIKAATLIGAVLPDRLRRYEVRRRGEEVISAFDHLSQEDLLPRGMKDNVQGLHDAATSLSSYLRDLPSQGTAHVFTEALADIFDESGNLILFSFVSFFVNDEKISSFVRNVSDAVNARRSNQKLINFANNFGNSFSGHKTRLVVNVDEFRELAELSAQLAQIFIGATNLEGGNIEPIARAVTDIDTINIYVDLYRCLVESREAVESQSNIIADGDAKLIDRCGSPSLVHFLNRLALIGVDYLFVPTTAEHEILKSVLKETARAVPVEDIGVREQVKSYLMQLMRKVAKIPQRPDFEQVPLRVRKVTTMVAAVAAIGSNEENDLRDNFIRFWGHEWRSSDAMDELLMTIMWYISKLKSPSLVDISRNEENVINKMTVRSFTSPMASALMTGAIPWMTGVSAQDVKNSIEDLFLKFSNVNEGSLNILQKTAFVIASAIQNKTENDQASLDSMRPFLDNAPDAGAIVRVVLPLNPLLAPYTARVVPDVVENPVNGDDLNARSGPHSSQQSVKTGSELAWVAEFSVDCCIRYKILRTMLKQSIIEGRYGETKFYFNSIVHRDEAPDAEVMDAVRIILQSDDHGIGAAVDDALASLRKIAWAETSDLRNRMIASIMVLNYCLTQSDRCDEAGRDMVAVSDVFALSAAGMSEAARAGYVQVGTLYAAVALEAADTYGIRTKHALSLLLLSSMFAHPKN